MIPSTDPARLVWAGLAILAWLALCLVIAVSRRARRRDATKGAGEPVLVAFASQTGFAEELAGRTAAAFVAGGFRPRVLPLGEITAEDLKAAGRAVFIVATTGEGDPPDSAQRFVRRTMGGEPVDLAELSYAVFALGDESYAQYCAFGRALDGWLHGRGARRLFDRVEANGVDQPAMRHWQHHINELTGAVALPDWAPADYGRWKLTERRLLNAGSPGGPIFDLAFEPLDGPADWAAGDIVEIGPRNPPERVAAFLAALGRPVGEHLFLDRLLPADEAALAALRGLDDQALLAALPTLPHREYSIASVPSEGRLRLLIRLVEHPGGAFGLGSGWLCRHASEGGEVALRIRRNSAFHGPSTPRPMILVGAGTGVAGLRAHLAERAERKAGQAWLLFGERSGAHDQHYAVDIAGWREGGVLGRIDQAFSRDGGSARYVQDQLTACADDLRQWVAEGAAIYVCGSLQGMSEGVDAALRVILGDETVERLTDEGLYRRDVY